MGRLNPHEHTVEFLQHYLNGDFSEDADDDEVEEERPMVRPGTVKALIFLFQRNPVYRWYWAEHCSKRPDFNIDPKMHDERSIKNFMREHEGLGKKLGGLTEKIAAEERVKAFRRSAGGDQKWREYIAKHGYGLKDPRCHPMQSLEKFLSQVNF